MLSLPLCNWGKKRQGSNFFFFLAMQHAVSQFPDQGPYPCPPQWKHRDQPWTTRKVPEVIWSKFFYYTTLATWWEEWLTGKHPDAGKHRRQKEKRVAEDSIIDSINGQEFEQTPRDNEGQRSLASMGHKESDMTWQLNKNNNFHYSRVETQVCSDKFYLSKVYIMEKTINLRLSMCEHCSSIIR